MSSATWLVKSEPEEWSFNDQMARGTAGEGWTGVRNHQAAGHLKAMRVGDHAFFYHSGSERAVVGIVEVTEPWQPDPTDSTGRFGMVVVRALEPRPRPVTLAEIKADPALADLALVRQSRLSVMPIPEAAWQRILGLSRG
jgi:predicted RNA-binding protein with PUA-like domain